MAAIAEKPSTGIIATTEGGHPSIVDRGYLTEEDLGQSPTWKRDAVLNRDTNYRNSRFVQIDNTEDMDDGVQSEQIAEVEDTYQRDEKRLSHMSLISGLTTDIIERAALAEPMMPTLAEESDREVGLVTLYPRKSSSRPGSRAGSTGERSRPVTPIKAVSIAPEVRHIGTQTVSAFAPAPPRPTTAPPAILLARGANLPILLRPVQENSPNEEPQQASDSPRSPMMESSEIRKIIYPTTIIGDVRSVATANISSFPSKSTTMNRLQSRIHSAVNRPVPDEEHAAPARPSPTDPTVIQAITQTMIGDYLYKYMRRVGGGLSEKKHRRFFWIHPYTKTIYWSSKAPGEDGKTFTARDMKAKSGMFPFAFKGYLC